MSKKDVIAVCRSFGSRFYSLSQVVNAMGEGWSAVRHKLWKLEQEGLVKRVKDLKAPPTYRKGGPRKEIQYRNTKAIFKDPASQQTQTGWDKLWKAARILRRFTRERLASVTGESISNVRAFTKAYRTAGYMKSTRKAGPDAAWIFVKAPPVKRPYYGGRKNQGGVHGEEVGKASRRSRRAKGE